MGFGTQVLSSMAKSFTTAVESVMMPQQRLLSVSDINFTTNLVLRGLTKNWNFSSGQPTMVERIGTTEIPEEIFMELL